MTWGPPAGILVPGLFCTVLLFQSSMSIAQSADELIRFLQHPSYKVRLQAAIQIGRKNHTAAAFALRQTLSDPSAAVRAASALALGQIGDQGSRKDLVALLNHPKKLVRKAAEKALGLLDQKRGISPSYLVLLEKPILNPDIDPKQGRLVKAILEKQLQADAKVVLSAGEPVVLHGKRLGAHLRKRKLKGITMRPKVLHLSVQENGRTTTIGCKISIMTLTMVSNRMEFSGSGEAEASVGSDGLHPDQAEEIKSQVLVASIEAAVEEVLDYLRRRRGP